MSRNPVESVESNPQKTTLYFHPHYGRSPFFEATRRDGCRAHDVHNHVLLPSEYGDPIEEYWHLLEKVVVWDASVQHVVEIAGPDAVAFADRLTPRDLTRCEVGRGRYVQLTGQDGGIVNDAVLHRLESDRFWLSLGTSEGAEWIRGLAHAGDHDVAIDEPEAHPVQIQGPDSQHVVGDLFGPAVRELPYYGCTETELGDIPVVVGRTGWSGEVGYEVYLRDPDRGTAMWDRIMEAGEPYDIRPTPPSEIRRIEVGLVNYGSDVTRAHNPLEVSGMERFVELDASGEFIGRDALARIEREGVDRKLVGIELDGELDTWIATPWSVHHDGREVGRMTAGTYSPRLERSIGYVWVPIELADAGTELRVESPDGETDGGTTTPLPFHDPDRTVADPDA